MITFDGRKIRDEILEELESKIEKMKKKPVLAVILIGGDPVSVAYIGLKKKLANKIGIDVNLNYFDENISQDEVTKTIKKLNDDENITGIMVQIPVPNDLNRDEIIKTIDSKKDVDGLRYCAGLDSDFPPPVIAAIDRAIKESNIDLENSNAVIVGNGFLVGKPLARYLEGKINKLTVLDSNTEKTTKLIKEADIIISAVGKPEIVKPEMIKDGVVLIDAGTSEVGGELKGDVDSAAYHKSSYYTPVPGGIGPVTVAMLLSNLVK